MISIGKVSHHAASTDRAWLICLWAFLASGFPTPAAFAQADAILPEIGGGGGGQFTGRCPQGEVLTGFDLRAGDDIDAIAPICIPAVAGQFKPYPQKFGGDGGSPVQVVCPNEAPAVMGLTVGFEGVRTITVNSIHLYCGRSDATSSRSAFPSAMFNAPRAEANCDFLDCTDTVKSGSADQQCPSGLIGVGIHGRAGKWLDSVGLICGAPTVTLPPLVVAMPESGVKPQGRVKTGAAPGPARPICELAAQARARNSPAAPGLEAKCAEQETLQVPALAAKGEAIANEDPLAVELRNQQVDDSARRGFDIGMAAAEGQTLPGPGKQRIHDSLSSSEQGGFSAAVSFSLERNRNAPLAARGAAITAADTTVAAFRNSQSGVHYRLGFDIAMGFYYDPDLSPDSGTASGLRALAIREGLSAAGKQGFDAGTLVHQSGVYKP